MNAATPLLMPQVNVNDETVLLVRWTVEPFAVVKVGDVVCEVETTKATAEVIADRGGVLLQSAAVGQRVRIGEVLGVIGDTREAVAAYTAQQPAGDSARDRGELKATPKARVLAAEHGIALEALATTVRGTIKESDVQAYLSDHQKPEPPTIDALPAGFLPRVEHEGPLPPFDAAVAASLRRSVGSLILTTIDRDLRLAAAQARMQQSLAAGRMVSLLHLVIAAVARSLPRFVRLMSVVYGGELYRYRNVDVAFVARSPEGRLHTPVVRSADRLDVDAIAAACQSATLKVMRRTVKADELEGACFTVSHVPIAGTTRVVALPNFGQSAVLGVSGERFVADVQDGALTPVPIVTLTLTYDHTVCDGVYAAEFLAAVVADIEAPAS